MIGAMFNGMTGIASFDRAIAVESNNVSNTATIGHKEDQVRFEDMIYKKGFGKGTSVQTIQKNFFQGEIQVTNVNLDVAIEGNGFFVVKERTTGDIYYTRAGNFQQAEDGLLETQEKYKVLGLSPQEKNIVSSDPTITSFTNEYVNNILSLDIKANETVYNFNVKTTDYNATAQNDLISGDNYKTASSKKNDIELLKNNFIEKLKLLQSDFPAQSIPSTTQISEVDYSSLLSQLNDENDSLQVTINGNIHRQYFQTDVQTTLKKLSDKISNTLGFTSKIDTQSGVLTIESLIPGKEFTILESSVNENYVPNLKVQSATLGSGLEMLNSSREAFKNAVERADADFLEITHVLSFADKSVLGNDEINLRLNALGLVENELGSVTIGDDGLVYVTSENNKFLVSKIQTADFRNQQGLEAKGSNIFQQSSTSGNPFNADNLNKLVSNAIESGNTSYSGTLTKLLVYQKAFEANAKSISISDEFLQTAIQMKK